MIMTEVRVISRAGFFIPKRMELPENLAKMTKGINRMCDEGIFKSKPHLKIERDVYKISVDTGGVSDKIIKEVKQIAIQMDCEVEEDTCFHWLRISNKKEDIKKYFEGDD